MTAVSDQAQSATIGNANLNEDSHGVQKFWDRIFSKRHRPSAADRRHVRYDCACVGTLAIANRSIILEGIITEISRSGVKFRPTKTYLLERTGVQVSIEFAGIQAVGKIAAARPDGYGVALFEEIDVELIEEILQKQSTVIESLSD